MIYLVSNKNFKSKEFQTISVKESKELLKNCNLLQLDTETTGIDCYLDNLLTVQLGTKDDNQIVIDCTTVDILEYKDIIENSFIIGHNLKFDLQFLYNYQIIPRRIWDTMIVEQLLYLGYSYIPVTEDFYIDNKFDFPFTVELNPHDGLWYYYLSFSLKAIASKYLNVDIDKSVRESFLSFNTLTAEQVVYAANDVLYLEKIMNLQLQAVKKKDCFKGAKLECDAVPAMAYLEWCGIKLDKDKWLAKMKKDQEGYDKALNSLNDWLRNWDTKQRYWRKNYFSNNLLGESLEPFIYNINWSSPKQAIEIAKQLGFNTIIQDKKTRKDKDSVLEKHLSSQKGINDEFLKLYFDYQEKAKLISSFGQGHLNIINPKTGRIHTNYKQIGASSGRMSCGGGCNSSIASYYGLPDNECKNPNIQQLPHDEETRACFVAEEGNIFCSCDYSAEEARLSGDIYNDEAIIDMFLNNIDSHSYYAKIFFKEELKDIDVRDVKKLRPDLRNLAKGPEFALNFGGGATAIMQAIQCTEKEANIIIKNYEEGFKGTAEFARRGSKLVRQKGYVLISPYTGHKMYWWDHCVWLKRQKEFTKEFWEDYKINHKGTGDDVCMKVSRHTDAKSKYDRMARNSPTQGTGAIIMKDFIASFFNEIIKKGYFGKVKIVALVHDECNIEYPKDSEYDWSIILKQMMEISAGKYCKKLPIPAVPECAECWKH